MKDRNGTIIKVGQRLRVQHCIGPYGQTKITEGVVVKLMENIGATLDTATGLQWVTMPHNGYYRHDDFEHGHEKWSEVVA